MQFAYLFREAKGLDKFVLGGKGYGLVEMSSIGLPVPPGIVITTEACKRFNREKKVPPGLFDEVRAKLTELERETGRRLGYPANPLLLSVRSGAPYSMPGMMDTILNLGMNDEVVESLSQRTGNDRFAMDAYRRLIQMYGKIAMGVPGSEFEAHLEAMKKRLGVAKDTEIPAKELRQLVNEYKEVVKKSGL